MKEEIAEVEESIELPKSLSDASPPEQAGASISGAAIAGSVEHIKARVGNYSWVVFAFQTAYAIGLLVAGRVMDWLGTRKGFSLSVFFWSVAAMGHALVSTVIGFSVARFALGLGESGNFPASIKTVAEWFPRKERA